MKAETWERMKYWGILFLSLVVLVMAASCSGGGSSTTPTTPTDGGTSGPPKVYNRPIISSVAPKVVSAGQTVTIKGSYFGDKQETDSFVTINGRRFTIVTWSKSLIEATVPTSATSGIVVVTAGTLSSQSGIEAQLFIGEAPAAGNPLIIGLSQDTGRQNEEITIYGFNFGSSETANSQVFFYGTDTDGNACEVPAPIVSRVVDGVEQVMWSDTSIHVLVPRDSRTGPIFVSVGSVDSNKNFLFVKLPPLPGSEAPVITDVTPLHGPVGTTITITGQNFGESKGISVVTIGGLQLQVVNWSDIRVAAVIPQGATSNLIRLLVGGLATESPHEFTVEAVPVLTAVSPMVLRVGGSMRIYGRNLGQATGRVILTPETVGGGQAATTVSSTSITSWSNTEIYIDHLPSINSDAGIPLDVSVASGAVPAQNSANTIRVDLVSSIEATLSVDIPAGVEDVTTFTFSVGAGGGVPPYDITFMFGDEKPSEQPTTRLDIVSTTTEEHIYGDAGIFTPSIRVTDNDGSRITVTGTPLQVVATGMPVIYDVVNLELDTGLPENFKPNGEVGGYFGNYLGSVYNFDQSFIPCLTDVGLDFMGYARRQYGLFVGNRPFAYREGGGSKVMISGFNLLGGNPSGAHILDLNYDTGILAPFSIAKNGSDVITWDDTNIIFRVPNASQYIGGQLGVVFDGGELDVKSPIKLVAAPKLCSYSPMPPSMSDVDKRVVYVQFTDPIPPEQGAYMGNKAYLFVTFPATSGGIDYVYDRNGDGSNDNYLLPGGIPMTFLPGQTEFNFDLSTIAGGNYAARNPDALGATTIGVTPKAGDWKIFLWVGAKMSPFAENFAHSGIISNALTLQNVTN
jgi:hypothetical protein